MSKKGFNNNKELAVCSFCGRSEEDAQKLISGPNVYICDNCIRLCMSILEKKPTAGEFKMLKPLEIKNRLDEFIVGQESAKRTMKM